VVDPVMGEEGWVFSDYPGSIPDYEKAVTELFNAALRCSPLSGRTEMSSKWKRAVKN
jgi:putative glutathione S-transferase